MKQIWKFALDIQDCSRAIMPVGARLLTVQTQNGIPHIWAEVETTNDSETRLVHMRGTGHPMKEAAGCDYIGTFQLASGQLVFHCFDGGPKK